MIDKKSPIPVYYQLKKEIEQRILNKEWNVGQCISSERELSEEYSLSRMTVRQAIGELVSEGVLVREKGRGTFICEPKVRQKDMTSLSEIAERNGLKLETRVKELSLIDTPEKYKEIFSDDKIYKIDRLRIINKDIVADEVVYIPCRYFSFIDEELLKGSLFSILKSNGYEIEYSDASIRSVLPDARFKRIFNVEKNIPILNIYSVYYSKDDNILFVENSVYRSDKFTLDVNISKRDGRIR